MSNGLTVQDINKIHQIGDFGVNELAAMKESMAKKLTVPQFNLFMYQMNRMGLDPNLGHGVPILYGEGDKATLNIRIEYEGLKSLAQDSSGFKGVFPQVVCEGEDFEAFTDDEGLITSVKHTNIKFPRGKVVGSYAIAKRENFPNFIALCDNREFDRYAKKNPAFWILPDGSIDPDMARKHAATRAVKGQFDIANVVESGMSENNEIVPTPYERKEINPNADPAPEEKPVTKPAGKSKAADSKVIDVESTPVDEAAQIKAVNEATKAGLTALGIISKEDRGAYMRDHMTVAGDVPTLDERKALLTFIENAIAAKNDDLPE